ncbi:MAG: hypothetical protein ABI467_03260 [Kofleriaceae bacterium]
MGESTRLAFADLERAIAVEDPQLGALITRYLDQPDPIAGEPEIDPGLAEAERVAIEVPPGAVTVETLKSGLSGHGMRGKNATEKKLARREAFAAAESSVFAPPRLRLGKVLLALYEQGTPAARAALLHVFARAPIKWGVWQGMKAIYKLSEQRHDAAMFGALACRFDRQQGGAGEIGGGTFMYLKRRAWRYLRGLARALPDAYATFCVELLRNYPADQARYQSSLVAAHIWAHEDMRWVRGTTGFSPPTGDAVLVKRAFPAAWKLSPAPLLRLLEAAENDAVCGWAIDSLRGDHPLALRAVEPAWLARLGMRPFGSIHAFVVRLLKDSPEFHQSKLRGLGLHDMVLAFLRSPAPDAQAYAIEYAAAHAPELPVAELVELVEQGSAPVKAFAAARLEQITPQQLGIAVLARLLVQSATPWAAAKLAQGFSPDEMNAQLFVDTAARGASAYNALVKFWNDKHATIPASYFTAALDDPRFTNDHGLRQLTGNLFTELGKRTAREIGVAWIRRSLELPQRTSYVARWLAAGMLSGGDLDLDWLKALVAKPRLRSLALTTLADRRLVEPSRIGLSWLLELARSTEPDLAGFAQRMLLESFEPRDFGGVDKLWEMATGKQQPEVVRTFAATYLKAHHPELGPRLVEAKALGIQPRLGHDAYALARIRTMLDDERADVRRLAVAIADEEIVRWNDSDLVYELAGSAHREARALGSELLLGVLVEATEGAAARRVPASWVDGRRLFQLAESPQKAAREVALTLIRRLYDRVGGAERLAWLMDAPERDVRLFAVRLFWDRHRPRELPESFVPRKPVGVSGVSGVSIGTQRFADLAVLRQFARVVLFGLPPGRVGERDAPLAGAAVPERPLAASVAKQRLIEALRDAALEDVELARAITPVLEEMSSSIAKGEWQASVQALTQLRAHHAELEAGP